jgi:glycine betaine/proline transport system ATP-binding protein
MSSIDAVRGVSAHLATPRPAPSASDAPLSVAPAETRLAPPVKLACRGLWKVFGKNASAFLARHHRPSASELAGADLIGAARDVTIDIRDGETFVIMGLSGSGKSTLLRCLARLIEPTRGEVTLEGRSLLDMPERELIQLRRHRMGMVFQNFALLPHLSVLDNVAFPLAVQGIKKAERLRRAREVIELVGLASRESAFPRELSGGQQQRVGIARSLVVGPQLWFLDEPFSALDPLIRRELQSELLRLQSVLHKTIVFITHDFNEAARLADRIAIMRDGEIIQVGTPEELATEPVTPYVAEFTRDIPAANVISAGRLMRPAGAGRYAGRVGIGAKVASFAADIVDAPAPFAVIDVDGRIVGEIAPGTVIDLLVGRPVGR